MRLERTTFGPVLRAARERRGLSLDQLAAETKVSLELWTDLEDNDFSRWPARLYARTYVREYAVRVGLDPETVVNEFCRLFPEQGDRRAEGLLRRHAAIIQHELDWQDEPPSTPDQRDRRVSDRSAAGDWGFLGKHGGRLVAVALDIGMPLALSLPWLLLQFGFWPSLALSALVYHAVGVFLSGRTIGMVVSDWSMRALRLKPAGRRLGSPRAQTS